MLAPQGKLGRDPSPLLGRHGLNGDPSDLLRDIAVLTMLHVRKALSRRGSQCYMVGKPAAVAVCTA